MKTLINSIVIVLIILSLFGATAPDTVVVVYESSEAIPPPYVTGALKQLASEGFQVRSIDKDVVTGEGEVPEQVKAAIAAATSPLPSLVALSGGVVVSSQPLPGTTQEIIEAVR